MQFKKLELKGWRQFSNVDIEFHPRLTILTGANGSGKTTILNILNKHYGWSVNFIATPQKDETKGILKYLSGLKSLIYGNKVSNAEIGRITYTNGAVATIQVPQETGTQYNLNISNSQVVHGLHIPSHRPIFTYRPVGQIPTVPPTQRGIFDNHRNFIMQPFLGNGVVSITAQMKQTLISLAVFGEGNKYVSRNSECLRLFDGFQEILKKVLPPELGFEQLHIENPEVVLKTKSGSVTLDAVSGGIAALIDISWQIFMSQEEGKTSVISIDEPENHLHPRLQRTLLPNLLSAFPSAQFVVVTHNPFIVTSEPDSNVYVFDFDDYQVSTRPLDFVNKAADANDVLRDVLDVPSASPIWVEKKLDEVIARYTSAHPTAESLSNLRNELKSLGMEKLFPDTAAKIGRT